MQAHGNLVPACLQIFLDMWLSIFPFLRFNCMNGPLQNFHLNHDDKILSYHA